MIIFYTVTIDDENELGNKYNCFNIVISFDLLCLPYELHFKSLVDLVDHK